VTLRRTGGGVDLTVSDTGQGISPDFLPRVFDAFRQGDASTTRVQPGLGLGLSIVKSLVEAHGGSIRVDSEGLDKGATFTAHFPLMALPEPRPARRDAPAAQPAESLSLLEGVSVLVVDDDEPSREVIAAHLHRYRARVLTAPSGTSSESCSATSTAWGASRSRDAAESRDRPVTSGTDTCSGPWLTSRRTRVPFVTEAPSFGTVRMAKPFFTMVKDPTESPRSFAMTAMRILAGVSTQLSILFDLFRHQDLERPKMVAQMRCAQFTLKLRDFSCGSA
jgi:hypothetical protein